MNLQVDGRRVFAYTAAHQLDPAKPTVMFVHGAGLDHSSFALQSRYFGYHGRNVLALDLPAHGRSEGPPLRAIPDMADWLSRVLETARVEKASIIGHSMGSLVALEFAARHPGQCERIALIALGYPMKVSEPFLEAARKNEYDAFDMHTIWGHGAHVPLAANPNPGMWMYGDALARLERLGPDVLHTDLKACNDYTAGLESAAKVKCPALLLLGGRRDVMTPPKMAQAVREKIAGAKVVNIDPSGHTLMAEAPDATLDALIAFIS
ncbi:MAG TPA: alpha/beta hydrolase [Burkholderiales bacterium]|nr:alpha/beta hydrolase [Burkholderiales bacterium]